SALAADCRHGGEALQTIVTVNPGVSSMSQSLPVICVPENGIDSAGLSQAHRDWARANAFTGKSGKLLALPGGDGAIAGYLFGLGETVDRSPLVAGLAAASLPAGAYRLEGAFGDPT